MIDINKKYETTDGGAVTLYTTNGKNPIYPVVGEVSYESGLVLIHRWTINGVADSLPVRDLVEVPIWEPLPELVAVLRPGWIACDSSDHKWWWYSTEPTRLTKGDWSCESSAIGVEVYVLALIHETMLPPINEQTMSQAFKIGNPEGESK
jgi:hypothetical protein